MDIQWKKQITKSFSLVGFSIKADAMKIIINKIKTERYETNITPLIEEILKYLDKSQLNNNIIDQIAIDNCFKLIDSLNSSDAIEKDALKVIDAFNTPLYNYDSNNRQFIKCENFEKSLHGSSKSKSDVYRKRYQMVLQRIERNESFSAPILASEKLKGDYQIITPLSSLLGSSGTKHILGTISMIEEDQFFIEDLNTRVKIDISKIENIELGLITLNTIIKASGEYQDGKFIADKIELPPKEERKDSIKFLQNIDLFGERPQKKTLEQLERYEKETDNSILFLSDVWLDSERVRDKLDYLFTGYSDIPPFAIVLMGNFTEHPLINGSQYDLKKNFNHLANLIIKHPSIHKFTQFIFVPGPTDPTGSLINILPKLPISNVFVKEFQQKVPKSIFTTNPCRIRYCTQEIIIFRDDITNKMRRHCIVEPSDKYEISQHLLELIWSNSHLCNLTLEDKPIYWNYDHALSLYPLPDLLVIGDKAPSYSHSVGNDTTSTNPSSFSTDYSFIDYSTKTRECNYSRADSNNEEDSDDCENNDEEQDGNNDNDDDDDEMVIDENEEKRKNKILNKLSKNKNQQLNSLQDDEEIIEEMENGGNGENSDGENSDTEYDEIKGLKNEKPLDSDNDENDSEEEGINGSYKNNQDDLIDDF